MTLATRLNLKLFPIRSILLYNCEDLDKEQGKEIKKARMGRDNDGGYIILGGYDYDLYLGCGISNDDSFETAFNTQFPHVPAFAFDGTIDNYPSSNSPVKFIRKNIANVNSEPIGTNCGTTNLHDYLNTYKNVFLKMDIEGHEYQWINSLSTEQLLNIRQIVMEFHFPFEKERWRCLQRLSETHWLCHIHGNNYQDYSFYSPNVIDIGPSETNEKIIKAHHEIPRNAQIRIVPSTNSDRFEFTVLRLGKHEVKITAKRLDKTGGWDQNLQVYYGDGAKIPNVFEVTYIRKSDVKAVQPPFNTEVLPMYLDQKNYTGRPDIVLTGFPYTQWR
jgi:hypothetical protein